MPDINFFDQIITHQISTQKLIESEKKALLERLAKADKEVFKELNLILAKGLTNQQIDAFKAQLRGIYQAEFQGTALAENKALLRFINDEIDFQTRQLARTEGEEDGDLLALLAFASASIVLKKTLSVPFQGNKLADLFGRIPEDRITRIIRIMNKAKVDGLGPDDIRKQIRDQLKINDRNAGTVINSLYGNAQGQVLDRVVKANPKYIKELIWLSVLDHRTSPYCQPRHLKRYDAQTKAPIGHGFPWGAGPGALHYNCRSTYAFAPPTKSRVEAAADDYEPGSFEGLNMVEINKALTYSEYLKRQPRAFVIDILGKTRAELFLSGKVPLENFYEPSGRKTPISNL